MAAANHLRRGLDRRHKVILVNRGPDFTFAEAIIAAIAGQPSPARFDGRGGCFIEAGSGRAAYGTGNFYADPAHTVTLHHPARLWHWSKVAFEQQVMRRWL